MTPNNIVAESSLEHIKRLVQAFFLILEGSEIGRHEDVEVMATLVTAIEDQAKNALAVIAANR